MVSTTVLHPTTETEVEAGFDEDGRVYLDFDSGNVLISFLNCPKQFLEDVHFQTGAILRELVAEAICENAAGTPPAPDVRAEDGKKVSQVG